MKTFIVTDPCYIMNNAHYDYICYEQDCKFEKQAFPLFTTHAKKTDVEMVIHNILSTGGDGGYDHPNGEIGVDAGMLCVAEIITKDKDWYDESLGAKFETLKEANEALTKVVDAMLHGEEDEEADYEDDEDEDDQE